MNLDAEKRARRSRAIRLQEKNQLSPVQPKAARLSDSPDKILRTPVKRQKVDSNRDASPSKLRVACGTPQTPRGPPLVTPDWKQRPYVRGQKEARSPAEKHDIVPPSARFKWSKQGHMSPVLDKEFKAQFVQKMCKVNEKSARECTKVMGEFIRRTGNQWEFREQAGSSSREDESSGTVTEKSTD